MFEGNLVSCKKILIKGHPGNRENLFGQENCLGLGKGTIYQGFCCFLFVLKVCETK